MLKGLLSRRQSSQVATLGGGLPGAESAESVGGGAGQTASGAGAGVGVGSVAVGGAPGEPMYGDSTQDQGDEVRFYVELTRLDRLNDTFSLDIRRLKGNLRSYKFLYDTLRGCVVLFFSPNGLGLVWVGRALTGSLIIFVQARRSSAVKNCWLRPLAIKDSPAHMFYLEAVHGQYLFSFSLPLAASCFAILSA